MRTIVIGDIHGCLKALESLLEAINPTEDDTIVTLGDVIDRGPDSKGVIELLMSLSDKYTLIPIMGNHELMLMRAFEAKSENTFWYRHGGQQTLQSYGFQYPVAPDELAKAIPREHMRFLADFLAYYEDEHNIFVHAGYDWDAPMAKQTETASFWKRITFEAYPRPHRSGKTVWVGHSPQHQILDLGHVVCIDTNAFGNNWLTAVDVNTRERWQADNTGQVRNFQLG